MVTEIGFFSVRTLYLELSSLFSPPWEAHPWPEPDSVAASAGLASDFITNLLASEE